MTVITHDKRCSRCDTTKPIDSFSKNKSKPDGRDHLCRPCRTVVSREQYHKDRNPQYYEVAKDKQREFLDGVLQSYDDKHVRVVRFGTRARYQKFSELIRLAIMEELKKRNPRAKVLAKYYKSLQDLSPWRSEIAYPSEWRAVSRALRSGNAYSLYHWLRTHYEVEENVDP